jgi:hypothetical protein
MRKRRSPDGGAQRRNPGESDPHSKARNPQQWQGSGKGPAFVTGADQ